MSRTRALLTVLALACLPSLLVPTTAAAASKAPPNLPTLHDLTLVPGNPALSYRLALIEKAVEAKRKELHVPGAALIIVKDDKILYQKGFGLRNVERKLPVTPDTLFAIGSCSKAFTGMTVMMSAEDGKLALKDPPRKYLPYFKLSDPDADKQITIGDLLCHRCGLDRTDLAWYTGRLRPEQIIRVAGQAKPTAKFGEKFQYQNVMFLAAGEVVAQAQKTSWETFLARRLFQPLGMKNATCSVRVMQRRPDYAQGYQYNPGPKTTTLLPIRDISCVAPAGAINASVREMAQWVRFLLNGGVRDGKRLVSETNFKTLFAEHMKFGQGAYGYGWFLNDWKGHKVASHGGNIDGYSAMVGLMLDQKLGLVVLTNANVTSLPNVAMNTVWTNLVDAPKTTVTTAAAPAEESGPERDLASLTGTYRLAEAALDLIVEVKDGKLVASPKGQPSAALERVGKNRYKAAPPAPPNVFLTFRAAKSDPNEVEAVLEQSGATFTMPRTAKPGAFTPPMTAGELMQKVVAAAGGEANLRKPKTMVVRFTVAFENEGLTGNSILYARAPNAQTEHLTLLALGRRIGFTRDYFDGKQGGTESDFTASAAKSGKDLVDSAILNDFYHTANWKTLFKTIAITGKKKMGDEDVYVVEKTPEKGSPITDYISMKTFLLVQRDFLAYDADSGDGTPISETYSDYRAVNGLLLPFRRVRTTAGRNGRTVLMVQKVELDVPLADALFQPGKKRP